MIGLLKHPVESHFQFTGVFLQEQKGSMVLLFQMVMVMAVSLCWNGLNETKPKTLQVSRFLSQIMITKGTTR